MKLSKVIAIPAIALAAGGAALGVSFTHSTPPAAVKVLPQKQGPRNLGNAGPPQLNGSPANMQKLAHQKSIPVNLNPNAASAPNWAGYAATGGTYKSVSASWTQPTVTCPAAGSQSAAFWVGLDGDVSQTVEQTGIEAACNNGAVTYWGWFEMFPSAPVTCNNPVAPGDTMSASVVANGSAFTLTLSDSTQGWTRTTRRTDTNAQLSSAEIIAEVPLHSTLANFDMVRFTNVMINGQQSSDSNTAGLSLGSGGTTEAAPSNYDGNAFYVYDTQ